jgi:LPS export ABC transporter permease LptG
MRLLDRYVLMKFAVPFFYCMAGFLAIWFIFDLADNLQDFMQGRAPIGMIFEYYRSQIPQILIMALPISILLGLLYSFTAMSRSNEIISMLAAGVSVWRIITPLLIVGFLLGMVAMALNYELVPHAGAARKELLRDIKRGKKIEESLRGHLFRNRKDRRTWFASRIWMDRLSLQNVLILQQDEKGNLTDKYYAEWLNFRPDTAHWELNKGRHIKLDAEGREIADEVIDWRVISDWSETPWRISSSVMNPDYLSVRELREYLTHNSDFPESRLAAYRTHAYYRWAMPTICVIVVLLAAPMGIVYSRRGILGSISTAIALFFSLVFLSSLFIALGKGGRIPPFLAAWLPFFIFACIGVCLVWFRSTGRELPKLRMPWMS